MCVPLGYISIFYSYFSNLIFKVELKKKNHFLGDDVSRFKYNCFFLANILEQTTIFGLSFSLGASGGWVGVGWGGVGKSRYFW